MAKKKTIVMMFLAIAGYGFVSAQSPNGIKKDKKGGTFEATFTKWITKPPNMVGVVGGDVGNGKYSGEILHTSTVGDITKVEALYHINGRVHSFTAHLYVRENDAPGMGTAESTGRVTEGWMKGATVTGKYKVWATCPIATPGNGEGSKCYQGSLQLIPVKKKKK